MVKYLTAEEMRNKSSERHIESKVNTLFDKIYSKIEETAIRDGHLVVVYTREFANYLVREYSDELNIVIADKLVDKIESFGYKVDEGYRELSKIVDMELTISW